MSAVLKWPGLPGILSQITRPLIVGFSNTTFLVPRSPSYPSMIEMFALDPVLGDVFENARSLCRAGASRTGG